MRNAFTIIGLGLAMSAACGTETSLKPEFTPTASMTAARMEHTATLLRDGTVLIAGGKDLASAELFDPTAATFTSTAAMATPRSGHTATRLPSGSVLIAGGSSSSTVNLASAELFGPGTATFTATGDMITPRLAFTATLLTNGMVLMVGGQNSGGYLASAELYDPSTGTFTAAGSMGVARAYHTATLLNDGRPVAARVDLLPRFHGQSPCLYLRDLPVNEMADTVLVGDAGSLPAEGTLLPETYLFMRGATRGDIIDKMERAQQALVDTLWASRAPGLPIKNKQEAIILASIVEKETALPAERRHIASVFVNRLRIGMKLQSDPTIIYGITKGYPLGRRILAQSDILPLYDRLLRHLGLVLQPGGRIAWTTPRKVGTGPTFFLPLKH